MKAAGKKEREEKREKCSGSEIFPEFGSERKEGMKAMVNSCTRRREWVNGVGWGISVMVNGGKDESHG